MADLEDTLRETLRGLNAEEVVKDEPVETPTEPVEPSTEKDVPKDRSAEPSEPAKSGRTANRLRDEKGRLLPGKKEQEAAPQSPEGAPKGSPVAGQAPAEAAPQQPEQPSIDDLQNRLRWRKGVVAKFQTLDPEVQGEILRRADDFHKGIEQYRTAAQLGSAIEKAAAPYRHLIEAEGSTLDRAFGDYLRTVTTFRNGTPQQKQQALMQVAQQFGIALPGFQQQAQGFDQGLTQEQAQALQQNPWLAQMYQGWQNQFGQLQQRISQFETQAQLRERQAAEQQDRAVSSAIDQFEAQNDKDGWMDDWIVSPDGSKTPGPFRNLMSSFLESGTAKTLNEAYEHALWAHPEARKVQLARQQAQADETRRKAQAVEQAKRAASVNVRSRGTLPATEATGSMEDTLRETYRRVAG